MKQVDRWIAQQRTEGARITPDHVFVGGFPFSFTIKLAGASMAWPDGFGFAPQSLKLRADPLSIRTVSVDVTGGYTVTLPPGSARPALVVAGETLRGAVHMGGGAVPLAVALKSDTVSVVSNGSRGIGARELTIADLDLEASRPEAPPKVDTDVALDLSIAATELSAAAIETFPLGGTIKSATIHAQLLGAPPATADAAGLKAWRDAGGTINAPKFAIAWGPLSVSGSGTVALDKDMQPDGAFSVRVAGFDPALDALAAAGTIKPNIAAYAKLGLGIAARPDADGKPVVSTPVTIQNRTISLGVFKLGQIPRLALD